MTFYGIFYCHHKFQVLHSTFFSLGFCYSAVCNFIILDSCYLTLVERSCILHCKFFADFDGSYYLFPQMDADLQILLKSRQYKKKVNVLWKSTVGQNTTSSPIGECSTSYTLIPSFKTFMKVYFRMYVYNVYHRRGSIPSTNTNECLKYDPCFT